MADRNAAEVVDRDHQRLMMVEELRRGKEFAKQLQTFGDDHQSQETKADLVKKIVACYERAIAVAPFNGVTLTASVSSSRSETSVSDGNLHQQLQRPIPTRVETFDRNHHQQIQRPAPPRSESTSECSRCSSPPSEIASDRHHHSQIQHPPSPNETTNDRSNLHSQIQHPPPPNETTSDRSNRHSQIQHPPPPNEISSDRGNHHSQIQHPAPPNETTSDRSNHRSSSRSETTSDRNHHHQQIRSVETTADRNHHQHTQPPNRSVHREETTSDRNHHQQTEPPNRSGPRIETTSDRIHHRPIPLPTRSSSPGETIPDRNHHQRIQPPSRAIPRTETSSYRNHQIHPYARAGPLVETIYDRDRDHRQQIQPPIRASHRSEKIYDRKYPQHVHYSITHHQHPPANTYRAMETAPPKKRKTAPPRWTKMIRVESAAAVTGIEGPPDDGYSWRKYGQKDILGANFPRGYYRCTYRDTYKCIATKQVQRLDEDPNMYQVLYRDHHSCTGAGEEFDLPPSTPVYHVNCIDYSGMGFSEQPTEPADINRRVPTENSGKSGCFQVAGLDLNEPMDES